MSEVCADESRVAVWSGHFAPDDADLAALTFCRSAVDVSDAFAEVEPKTKNMLAIEEG